jgi:hypothetical protein
MIKEELKRKREVEVRQKEMEECTFSPNIRLSSDYYSNMGSKSCRSINQKSFEAFHRNEK